MTDSITLATTRRIECPSGLVGTIRGLKVREERVLADRRLARSGAQMDALLSACWLETEDPGPYTVGEGGALPWESVLQGDRFFALLQIRALTYGDEYAFTLDCSNTDCRRKIDWTLNLSELPVRRLSDASREALLAGNRVNTQLPGCGRSATFSLATGADERRLTKLRETQPDRFLSALLAIRVQELEGVPAQEKRRALEDLSMRDARHLIQAFEQADCGVETGIELECSKCLNVMQVDLPLDPSFLWPSRKTPLSSPSAA